jgi:cytochrome c
MKRKLMGAALVLIVLASAALGAVAWADRQETRKNAINMTGGDPDQGRIAIDRYGCASCHTIPGVPGANSRVGPSLEKFGTRAYIGGVLQNEPGNLQHWILNPRAVDPLTAMPNLHVTSRDAQDIACYLYTLR